MRSRSSVIFAFMSLVGFVWMLAAAQAFGQDIDSELQKFQGTWVLVSAEMDGKEVHAEKVKHGRITFAADKVELFTPHQHEDGIVASISKLDSTKNPDEMHWVRSTGPNAGTTMVAIYEFEGPDQYKICFDPAGVAVPKKFETEAGSGHIRHTWKRIKK